VHLLILMSRHHQARSSSFECTRIVMDYISINKLSVVSPLNSRPGYEIEKDRRPFLVVRGLRKENQNPNCFLASKHENLSEN